MDFENIRLVVEIGGGALFTFISWTLKKAINDLREVEKSLAEFKLHVAENYVTQNGLEKVIEQFTRSNEAIMRQLERMDNKLDGKADKAL